MSFHKPGAEVYVPEGTAAARALSRTTHLSVGAHQDDIEIMAYHGILECFGRDDKHFTGVTVTNGAGSPRDGLYADYTDDQMRVVRRLEQKKAAFVGEFSAHVFLDYSTDEVKDAQSPHVIEDLKTLLATMKPQVIYTHNLADKHDTHVAVALRLIQALRESPPESRSARVYGCEVWRNLDWLNDQDKIVFDVEARENIAMSLVGVFDSQIAGGKRYDLATMGRRRANATYFAAHSVDQSQATIYGLDLTPLVQDDKLDVGRYVQGFVDRFREDVSSRIAKYSRQKAESSRQKAEGSKEQ